MSFSLETYYSIECHSDYLFARSVSESVDPSDQSSDSQSLIGPIYRLISTHWAFIFNTRYQSIIRFIYWLSLWDPNETKIVCNILIENSLRIEWELKSSFLFILC